MSGAILGTAFGAMQIVYAAYRDIKSNKENCTALVQRAEIVVEELKLLAGRQTQEEDTMTERVGTLLSAFENMAQVIRQIGHKNWLRALLDADRDAIQVEHCHRCLTDLMLLFNIEQGLDQWNLQQENEHARKRDHHDLLQVTQSVQSELATQGLLIGEVLDMVRTLSQSPTLNAPAPSASPISMTSHTYHRTGSPNLSKFQPITRRDTVEVGVREDSNMATPKSQRRVSWLDKLGLQRISTAQISIPGVGPTYSVKTQGISGSKAARTKGPLELVLGIPKHKSENLKVAARDLSDDNRPVFFRARSQTYPKATLFF
ncbi:hypothetical protein B0J17DRAFT_172725 [Rhizoctonia solani]|nr:hypothetical protein B0J17DRAFT_172725 [Rhizoctonia solani]